MSGGFDYTDKAIKALNKACYKAIFKASNIVKNAAIANAPVDLGNLQRSIDTKIEGHGKETVGFTGTNNDYAIFVEKGTGEFAENGNGRKGGWAYVDAEGKGHFTMGQRSQPYLEPAFKDNKKKIEDAIKSELKGVNF